MYTGENCQLNSEYQLYRANGEDFNIVLNLSVRKAIEEFHNLCTVVGR